MIPIILAMDSGSVYKMEPLIKSINDNISNNRIYLITDKNVNVSWAFKIKVFDELNINFPIKRITKHSWYRLYIDILFPELDKCIYLDFDTILLDDISNLIDGEDFILRAVRDYPNKNFCNAGVLGINLKHDKFKELINNARNDISEYNNDQDIINKHFKNYIDYVDDSYNTWSININKITYLPKLIHYIGYNKPFNEIKEWKYYYEYLY